MYISVALFMKHIWLLRLSGATGPSQDGGGLCQPKQRTDTVNAGSIHVYEVYLRIPHLERTHFQARGKTGGDLNPLLPPPSPCTCLLLRGNLDHSSFIFMSLNQSSPLKAQLLSTGAPAPGHGLPSQY